MVDMIEDEFPPVPTTALALAGRWLARDVLYEENVRMSLPESTVAVVRAQRQGEAMRLRNPKERSKMWRKAQTWTQPKHSDFGSLRDWLDD